jgi:hypothetical protein
LFRQTDKYCTHNFNVLGSKSPFSHYNLGPVQNLANAGIHCTSNPVHVRAPQCRPLLQALRFAKQANKLFQQAHCKDILVFILSSIPHQILHSLLSCSKHFQYARTVPEQLASTCPGALEQLATTIYTSLCASIMSSWIAS